MEEFLKSIQWESGFRIPVANAENQALENELLRVLTRKGQVAHQLNEANEKYSKLEDHLKYVRQETKQNQSLLSAYRQQMENEHHKYKLTLAENNNANIEIKHMKKAIKDIEDRLEVKRENLRVGIERLEKVKSEASWDAEALKAWEESLQKRDEDNELLKKFTAEDNRKYLEFEVKRQRLQVEVNERRDILSTMSTDITNSEAVMSRTATILKQMKEEREALVRQWQEAVKNLRQRDQAIETTNTNIDYLRDLNQEREDKLNEELIFLNNERNNNKFLDQQIEEDNIINSRTRRDLYSLMDEVALLNGEVLVKKREVEGIAHQLEREQMNLKHMKTEITEKEKSCWTLKTEIEALQQKLDNLNDKVTTASERTKQLEEMLDNQQIYENDLLLDLESLQQKLYKQQQIFIGIKENVASRHMDIMSLESNLVAVRRRFKIEDRELIKQKQRLSDLDMQVACIEAKIGNLEGAANMEENITYWNERITELDAIMAQENEVKSLLHSQVLSLQKETLRLVSLIQGDQDRIFTLKDKLQTAILQFEGGTKQAAAAKLRYQKTQVEENVLKLKVDRVGKAMNKEDSEIYNLRKYRLELETVLKERQIEIQTAKDILFAQKKNLDEERGRLRADIQIRILRISQLQNKYHLAIGLLGKDESGNPLTMAQFKIRSMQEKYMLQQEGDDLDKKVRKAESEIVAMENTLKIVNNINNDFKRSVTVIQEQDEEHKQLKEFENKVIEKRIELREKKMEYLKILDHFNEMQDQIKECEEKKAEISELIASKAEAAQKLEEAEISRLEKIARADRHISMCKKKIDASNLQKYDMDLYIRHMQDTSKNLLHQLADFCLSNPETAPVIKKYMEEQCLLMPTVRTSLSSLSSDSVKTATPSERSVCSVTNLELSFNQPGSSTKKN